MFICIFVPILKAHWITVCAEMTLTCHLSEIKATNKENEISVLLLKAEKVILMNL